MVSEPSETTFTRMFGTRKLDFQNSSGLAIKTTKKKKKKTIVVGLKSHSFSRDMLLRLLTVLVAPGDSVLAIHVQVLYDDFDPNSFHLHEDICKSKQVDLQVKVCTGDCFIAELVHQVRLHFATTLVIGCSSPRPKESIVTSCLKGLPPICTLLVMDNAGRIVIQKQGTSQQGSSCQNLQSTCHSPRFTNDSCVRQTELATAASTSKSSPIRRSNTGINDVKNGLQQQQGTSQQGSSCQSLQSTCHSPRFPNDSCVRRTELATAASTSKSSPIRRSNTGINDVKNGLQQGTSQQGSSCQNLQSTCHSPRFTNDSSVGWTELETVASTSKSSPIRRSNTGINDVKYGLQLPETTLQKQFQKLAILEVKGTSKRFTLQELEFATNYFSPEMVIGEGGQSKVYRAKFGTTQIAAVKVLQISQRSGEELLREVEILSGLNHENIIQLVGYCYSVNMHAVVYNLQQGSLKRDLPLLQWSERMRIAIGVAKALAYLHHSCSPPIIHRDVKSSNILLSCQCQPRAINSNLKEFSNNHFSRFPQLSDFGDSIMLHQQSTSTTKPIHVVGTFGYLAPEYMMYGTIDEKIDVYSYGVVLLELITGKEAIRASLTSNHESLVLWARSLLNQELCNRLIDPRLSEDYDKEEMQRMMVAARLCLMDSSSRRPTMEIILKLLEDPQYPLKMLWEREECFNEIHTEYEAGLQTDE